MPLNIFDTFYCQKKCNKILKIKHKKLQKKCLVIIIFTKLYSRDTKLTSLSIAFIMTIKLHLIRKKHFIIKHQHIKINFFKSNKNMNKFNNKTCVFSQAFDSLLTNFQTSKRSPKQASLYAAPLDKSSSL